MVMGPETETNYAGEGQQQFTGLVYLHISNDFLTEKGTEKKTESNPWAQRSK
jgi:hypothetical protein